jgi:hypothetical protein
LLVDKDDIVKELALLYGRKKLSLSGLGEVAKTHKKVRARHTNLSNNYS